MIFFLFHLKEEMTDYQNINIDMSRIKVIRVSVLSLILYYAVGLGLAVNQYLSCRYLLGYQDDLVYYDGRTTPVDQLPGELLANLEAFMVAPVVVMSICTTGFLLYSILKWSEDYHYKNILLVLLFMIFSGSVTIFLYVIMFNPYFSLTGLEKDVYESIDFNIIKCYDTYYHLYNYWNGCFYVLSSMGLFGSIGLLLEKLLASFLD